MLKKFLFYILFLFIASPKLIFAQSMIVKDTNILCNQYIEILLNSKNSFENNEVLLADYFPYNGPNFENFCSKYISSEDILQSISFKNIDSQNIPGFYFIINDEYSKNLDSLAFHLFNNQKSEKDKALNVFNYVSNNHLYYFAPNNLGINSEIYNASKFLNSFGFGHCGMIANSVSQLASKYTGLDQRFWFIQGGNHGVSEIKFDSNYVCIDADENAFYLLPDNKTLATFQDIYFDKYFYLRTKHFDKATPFNMDWNKHFNQVISKGPNFYTHTDTNLNVIEPCCNRINTYLGDNIVFNLKQNATLSFYPNEISQKNHFIPSSLEPNINTVLLNIGKGLIQTNYKSTSSSITDAISQSSNVIIDLLDTSYISSNTNSYSEIVISEQSPYVITDADFDISFNKNSLLDSINVYFSKDSIQWIPVIENDTLIAGYSSFNINMSHYILPNSTIACHQYYIKIAFKSESIYGIKINNINTATYFQYNKLTGPKFKNGLNKIQTFANNNHSIQIQLNYQEKNENRAPIALVNPIFPLDNSVVDSNYFTFRWPIPTEADGDAIIDYQIKVSNSEGMNFPVTTLFDRNLKLTNGGNPFFTPEIKDFLNPNQTYYWSARSQDSKGLWSDWSRTWQFKVKGPMYPKNLHWESISDSVSDIIKLVWQQNEQGDSAFSYKIFASNELNGFIPEESNKIATTFENNYLIHILNSKQRHRVKAYDKNNNESSSSYFVNLPFMYIMELHAFLDYVQSVKYYLDLNEQPYQPVNTIDRELFCIYDTSYFSINNTVLSAKKTGRTRVDICTKINNDTVYVFQMFLKINPDGNTDTFHVAPSLLITANDTTFETGDQITTNGYRIDGFIDADDASVLLTQPTLYCNANSKSIAGIYNIKAMGANSNKYQLIYQDGYLKLKEKALPITAPEIIDDIQLIPNPSSDYVNVNTPDFFINGHIYLTSPLGIKLSHQVISSNNTRIHTENLLSGIYIVTISDESNQTIFYKKIIHISNK